jgi:ABC-type nitrate/sulfonate/bicarbonate transport system substrate-binding protein
MSIIYHRLRLKHARLSPRAAKAQLAEKDVEDLLRVVQQDKIYFTGKLTPDILKRAVDFLVEEGSLKAPVDLNQFLDTSFWNEAFAR